MSADEILTRRREPIEAADGSPDYGHLYPKPLGLDLLDPAIQMLIAVWRTEAETGDHPVVVLMPELGAASAAGRDRSAAA